MSRSPVVEPVPGHPLLLLGAFPVHDVGYGAQEFFVSGTASSYTPTGDLGPEGVWSVTPSGTADFTTRIVALTPADRARFNGTVLVEWLNVSGGIDAPAVWMMAHREMIRAGYAYVAVSAQQVGVHGGANLLGIDMSLQSQDPDRYGRLSHPGDAFAFDIFSQIGGLVRSADSGVLGDLRPQHVIAIGESQSAMFLTTYINGVDPLARVYDGFLVHSRFGPAAHFDSSSLITELESSDAQLPVRFRPDLRVPLITIITETDLVGHVPLGYYFARQPDDEWLRVWEIPGAAHADNYTIHVAPIDTGSAPLDDIVAAYAPTKMLMGQQLGHYINFSPQHHYVVQAALAALAEWVRTGRPAPGAPPIEMRETHEAEEPQPILDRNGLALGGIRTPWVDVPTARTSSVVPEDNIMAAIFGSGEPFDDATLRRLYPGGAGEYLDRFTAALDTAIRSGFILPADREEILQLAAATYPGKAEH
ncbi:alpha/beta hydrolase domain-containing protein [Mycobacterium sp. 663a-19]|uniref:alpha/beta hydrolase domain-containing protein n=1 Tax=Mycobacterium sp. 663a-19 TaxID=2986148 RepID=UPI002D1F85DA|nr:alpha/beta hydrolase domain-containing protein [Mycobacterium sp. 663a-19]MEB3980568.1 alpha/beta hydrolase domain-containing protein [Mycobacterium sp. 663a-19]